MSRVGDHARELHDDALTWQPTQGRLMPEDRTFHILHPTGDDIPMPVTFYLSREIMMDDVITDEQRATALRKDLEFAIGHYRERLMGGSADA